MTEATTKGQTIHRWWVEWDIIHRIYSKRNETALLCAYMLMDLAIRALLLNASTLYVTAAF